MKERWTRRIYGKDPETQYFKFWLPAGIEKIEEGQKFPVFVIVHGGFFKNRYTVENAMHTSLAPFLSENSHFVMDVEYRRRDHEGGGFPGTNEDIVDAMMYILTLTEEGYPIDMNRIVLMGHSAGGNLALWYTSEACSRDCLPRPRLVVALAPITDMFEAHNRQLSDEEDAIEQFMKCRPESSPVAQMLYTNASPIHRQPFDVSLLLVAGRQDEIIPMDMLTQYWENVVKYEVETKGSSYMVLDSDHFKMVDAVQEEWRKVYNAILKELHVAK